MPLADWTDFTAAWVCRIYGQLINTLSALESDNIIHRNLNPSTILVSLLQAWVVSFSHFTTTSATRMWKGNLTYNSPEVRESHSYNTRANVYSLNIVFSKFILPRVAHGEV